MGKFTIYILLDTSGSMDGEPISKAKHIILDFVSALRNNSETSDKSDVSILAYNMSVTALVQKQSIDEFSFPDILKITSGPKNLGLALQTLRKSERNVDLTLVITKGNPSDIMLFNQESPNFRNTSKHTVVLHGNIAKAAIYSLLTDKVITWDKLNMSQLISQIFGGSEMASNDGRELLQAPPKTIELII